MTASSDCQDCAAAMTDRHWAQYRTACQQCQARRIAGGPAYFASEVRKRILPAYKAELETLGARSLHEAHMLCRAWRDRLDELAVRGAKEKV